jgi:DNA-binding transcriptional ArsR family regulator
VSTAGTGAAAALAEGASVFAALGDRTRLRIVARLVEGGPSSIAHLTGAARVSRQAVTKHLRALEAAGLARSRRAGRERLFALEPRRLLEARRYLDEISLGWDRAIGRLKRLVEEP